MFRPTINIVLALAIITSVAIAYATTKPGLRRLLYFYGWKMVAGQSHGGNYVKSGDALIYYETFGSGPPVLVLHGGLGSLEDMDYQIRTLAKSHFVKHLTSLKSRHFFAASFG